MSRVTDAVDAIDAPDGLPPEGMVVSSHPLAVEAGLEALRAGGTAVDAAVAAAAVLGVVDPMSTSLGGDVFALVWDQDAKALHGYNGSGRAPAAATLEDLRRRGHATLPERGWLPVTVPGAVDAFDALLARFGRRDLGQALAPAIRAAKDGFAATPVVARDWAAAAPLLEQRGLSDFLPVPKAGQHVTLPALAGTLEALAAGGRDAFYRGAFAERLGAASEAAGGWLRAEDLAAHAGEWVAPLEGAYRGHPVYELPPNGQGLIVLQALAMLEEYPLADLPEDERTHLQIEALKLAFADAAAHLGDPAHTDAARLLDPAYLEERCDLLDAFREKANTAPATGLPRAGGDTVYVAAMDPAGNACSLIHSTYMHFGAGVAVDGVVLQNRGALFSADPHHPSALGPGRRPYHTIIPAMVFRSDHPWLVFGVVGGYQQPQAQVQLLVRLIDLGESLQDALDAPRFRWLQGATLKLEEGVDPALRAKLEARGHRLAGADAHGGFGGAQAILVGEEGLVGASDPRKDGKVGRWRP
ncbi:MAG TPA: gamma-glutamyltransferase family protein [Polyangiaceae bacterium LLY-WYZ-15_(1-7)]|nr:gamma-glutamyltransferase [Myxococcales bacterium]MAT28897.1 gamma-glutamyltransferase [Sandaracinus sp.]HJL01751.1 gamma-glutamyltransferase family protein [Polyangiaceae bacterium LLY-WYZ-15_(1-7)]MBJ70697.1 gamma-glutamyltransferase [Sandaracinus sp.]HJL08013.1 gamma-glutamyltransferase family protein [Polyangiaceae bacterium LLY-WYZ-15_(1-7)]